MPAHSRKLLKSVPVVTSGLVKQMDRAQTCQHGNAGSCELRFHCTGFSVKRNDESSRGKDHPDVGVGSFGPSWMLQYLGRPLSLTPPSRNEQIHFVGVHISPVRVVAGFLDALARASNLKTTTQTTARPLPAPRSGPITMDMLDGYGVARVST
jgi:hypothetical protein